MTNENQHPEPNQSEESLSPDTYSQPRRANKEFDKSDEILGDLEELQTIEDSGMRQQATQYYINKRLQELASEKSESQATISLASNTAKSDFIQADTEVKRSLLVDGFNINDPAIYDELLKSFANFHHQWNKPNMRSIVGPSIIYALGNYFGNHISTDATESKNREYYMDRSSVDSETINLQELKGQKLAVCAEKASVAHNYLKFLGINSHLIFSTDCKLGDSNDGHAYICFATKNGKFIFDPTNPAITENADGSINSVNPAIYKISDEDYEHLLKRDGQQVTVQHSNQVFDGKEYKPKEPAVRVYG